MFHGHEASHIFFSQKIIYLMRSNVMWNIMIVNKYINHFINLWVVVLAIISWARIPINVQYTYIYFSKDKLLFLPQWKRLNVIILLHSPACPPPFQENDVILGLKIVSCVEDKPIYSVGSQTSLSEAKSVLLSPCLTPILVAMVTFQFEWSVTKLFGKEADWHA